MTCLVCGNDRTVKSHLIPRAIAKEVQIGKGHAFARGPNDYVHTQSGLFERKILCAVCDNKLGHLENVAAQAFRRIRSEAKSRPVGVYQLDAPEGDTILRFIAGILWKYSVASRFNGQIDLGRYQAVMRDISFFDKPIPSSVDALLVRLKRYDGDQDVFAYRAPKPDRKEGVNGARMLLGGVFIFAKLDKRSPRNGAMALGSIRGQPNLPYAIMPAQEFEEYPSSAAMVHQGKLSDYLDKQESS